MPSGKRKKKGTDREKRKQDTPHALHWVEVSIQKALDIFSEGSLQEPATLLGKIESEFRKTAEINLKEESVEGFVDLCRALGDPCLCL